MAYTKYSLTPANNNAAPPDGAPEGMLPSGVNDTMRDMMAQIRDVGDGIRDGTYPFTSGTVISANTSTNALRINQLGTGNALLVEDNTNPDSTPFVIDQNGAVVIGETAPYAAVASSTAITPKFQLIGTTVSTSSTGQFAWNTNPYHTFNKSLGSAGVYTAVTSGTLIGAIQFNGADGSAFSGAISIQGFADSNATAGIVPGRLAFNTANTSGNLIERMRINSAGEVLVGGNTSVLATDGLTIQKATIPELALFRDDTTIVSGNAFGTIGFYGNDTTANTPTQHAYIQAIPMSTHAAGDNPTDIVFATTPDGTATAAEAVRIKDGGGLQISRTAVTAPATGDGNVFSGTYTPTLTNTTNVAVSSTGACQYMRVGNVVTVSGQVDIDPTAVGDTIMGVSLPIASNLAAQIQCAGTFMALSGVTFQGGSIYGDSTNDRAVFRFAASSASNFAFQFTFTYRVI
jgi:hypothetical protein